MGNRVSISGNAQLAISLPRQAPQEGVATVILAVAGGIPIEGSFANAPEGGILTAGTTRFAVTYTGGDGNDLALTRLPDAAVTPFLTPGPVNLTFTGPESAPRSTLDLSATATTQPGGTVRLQRSTGLQNWTTIKTVTADETGSAAFSLTDVNGGPRVFFRYLLP